MSAARSQSSQVISREQSLGADVVQGDVNGDVHILSDGGDLRRDGASEDEDGDLFGDEADGDAYTTPYVSEALTLVQSNEVSGERKLDDAELDSGDDEGRQDRIADTVEEDEDDEQVAEEQIVKIYPAEIGRMAEPEPGDGDVSRQQLLFLSGD